MATGGGWHSGDEWGDLDIALVRVLAQFGYTYETAGRLLKRSRNSVAGACKRIGIRFPRRGYKFK